jgi:hypothetical protein
VSEITISLSDHDLLVRIDERLKGILEWRDDSEKTLQNYGSRLIALENYQANQGGMRAANRDWRSALLPIGEWILKWIIVTGLAVGGYRLVR